MKSAAAAAAEGAHELSSCAEETGCERSPVDSLMDGNRGCAPLRRSPAGFSDANCEYSEAPRRMEVTSRTLALRGCGLRTPDPGAPKVEFNFPLVFVCVCIVHLGAGMTLSRDAGFILPAARRRQRVRVLRRAYTA